MKKMKKKLMNNFIIYNLMKQSRERNFFIFLIFSSVYSTSFLPHRVEKKTLFFQEQTSKKLKKLCVSFGEEGVIIGECLF
jgi:hypothetical protein